MNSFYAIIALAVGLWLIKPAPPINWDEVPLREKVNSLKYWEYLQKSADEKHEQIRLEHLKLLDPQPLPPIVVRVRS